MAREEGGFFGLLRILRLLQRRGDVEVLTDTSRSVIDQRFSENVDMDSIGDSDVEWWSLANQKVEAIRVDIDFFLPTGAISC